MCYEIGWRLDKQYWNQGYATEAAKRVPTYKLIKLCVDKIVYYSTSFIFKRAF
ncbi:GNAT family N-acetyltransferase [Cysteiniphilum sp. 6C5]|uniref:GNAT family N-acetyltransferase n=1 Tax=unclassified Cysteiniphilum TaxID=2610889 RepID=UPI003F85C99C